MPNDLHGPISVQFDGLEDLCTRYIPEYEPERFKIVAVRLLAAKEFIITIYAADQQYETTIHPGKLMVRKFKIESMSATDFLSYIASFNFTVSDRDFDVNTMEVINK